VKEYKVGQGHMKITLLKKVNSSTQLIVDMAITEEFKEMFSKMWPVALDNIKRLSEN